MLIWSLQCCLFHRDIDGLADRPVVELPTPVPIWRAREMLRACRDQAGLAGELRMALHQAGQTLPYGPDTPVALIERAAERIASGALRLLIRPPASLAISFDARVPQAHRMGGTVLLPIADGAARRAAALRLLQGSLSASTLPGSLAALMAHPAGAVWRREVPREAGASDADYAAELIARRLLLIVPDGPRDDSFRLAWTLEDSQPNAPPLPIPPPPAPPAPPGPGPAPVETGQLSVHVTRPDGTPIQGADVAVDGLGADKTAADGFVHYGDVALRSYDATAKKTGFSGTAGGGFTPAEGNTTVTAGNHSTVELVLHPYRIISITGKVLGTQGTHGGKRGWDTLKTSTVDDKSLASNAPSVLVRGCHSVHLTAVTDPPHQPVAWSVEANENTDSPPSIKADKNAWEATMATGKHGSFSVIGAAGENQIVWNVVFVWLKVDVTAAVVTLTGAHYADNGSAGWNTSFTSGDFNGKATGKYPFSATATVRVMGGGASKLLGTDQVVVRYLQNGTADTLAGHYALGETAQEIPAGPMPILDTNGPGSPLIAGLGMVEVTPDQTAFKRDIWIGDSPGGGFLRQHLNTPSALLRTSGVNAFVAAIAGVSKQAPGSIVVAAKSVWTANFIGTVAAPAVAGGGWLWSSNGASTTGDGAFKLVSAGTGGQDAGAAGFDTFQPRFNSGLTTKWTP